MEQLLVDVAHSLREAFFMFWATLWALVLGFGISGAVQAFVPRAEMNRLLGRRGPREVARASYYGAASSSCSYAASAMAKTLFQRGADFVNSMVFMFASTNLVIELGIVLWVLMGWEFALAEYVGGAIMIVLLVIAARWVLRRRELEEARERLGPSDVAQAAEGTAGPRSVAGWANAASYTLADAKMLRRRCSPATSSRASSRCSSRGFWHRLFWTGHGFWTTLENVIVGPFIAILSFVCSVGNVPLAAALWHGGIGFGGVISFLFADLITLPLLLIYKRYYGRHLTLKLLALFWGVMSLAGLMTHYLFQALGIIPTDRPATIVSENFQWNYVTFLNIVFGVVLAGLWWLARNQKRLGGGTGYAIDPVCGMQVEIANAAASLELGGATYYFCCDHCKHKFAGARTTVLA